MFIQYVFFKLIYTESGQEKSERNMGRVKIDSLKAGNNFFLNGTLCLYNVQLYRWCQGMFQQCPIVGHLVYFQGHSAECLPPPSFTPSPLNWIFRVKWLDWRMWTIRNKVLPSLKRVPAFQCQLDVYIPLSSVIPSPPSGTTLNLWLPRNYCIFTQALWADPPWFVATTMTCC